MRHQGTIVEWNDARGFGFITPVGGGERVFVHARALASGQRRPRGSEVVTFELGYDDKRRMRALDVRYVGAQGYSTGFWIATGGCGAVLGGASVGAALSLVPFWLPLIHCVLSIVTGWTYFIDKTRAQQGVWRISESTLHLLTLLGGWPGALFAQQAFHHKNRKTEFQVVFWTTVVFNVAVCVWLAVQKPS